MGFLGTESFGVWGVVIGVAGFRGSGERLLGASEHTVEWRRETEGGGRVCVPC